MSTNTIFSQEFKTSRVSRSNIKGEVERKYSQFSNSSYRNQGFNCEGNYYCNETHLNCNGVRKYLNKESINDESSSQSSENSRKLYNLIKSNEDYFCKKKEYINRDSKASSYYMGSLIGSQKSQFSRGSTAKKEQKQSKISSESERSVSLRSLGIHLNRHQKKEESMLKEMEKMKFSKNDINFEYPKISEKNDKNKKSIYHQTKKDVFARDTDFEVIVVSEIKKPDKANYLNKNNKPKKSLPIENEELSKKNLKEKEKCFMKNKIADKTDVKNDFNIEDEEEQPIKSKKKKDSKAKKNKTNVEKKGKSTGSKLTDNLVDLDKEKNNYYNINVDFAKLSMSSKTTLAATSDMQSKNTSKNTLPNNSVPVSFQDHPYKDKIIVQPNVIYVNYPSPQLFSQNCIYNMNPHYQENLVSGINTLNYYGNQILTDRTFVNPYAINNNIYLNSNYNKMFIGMDKSLPYNTYNAPLLNNQFIGNSNFNGNYINTQGINCYLEVPNRSFNQVSQETISYNHYSLQNPQLGQTNSNFNVRSNNNGILNNPEVQSNNPNIQLDHLENGCSNI